MSDALLPWLAAPLRETLATRHGHALLVHGPGGVGQLELALALAAGWLCEAEAVPAGERPCGRCAGCRLVRARSHPDLLVLVPQALREALGWSSAEGEEGGEDKAGKKKPSKEIRVDEIRQAVAFALTTSARGRGKVVVVHPAERMNPIAANAFLKTLEEPAGAARFVLSSAAADALLPTIRSRCQGIALPVPDPAEAAHWLAGQGVAEPEVVLAACGGRPLAALERVLLGIDAAAWRALPERLAVADASAFRGWPLPVVVDALQRLCHDAACLAVGGQARFFPAPVVPRHADLVQLLAWSRRLATLASEVEHPWQLELGVENLVEQGRQALQTPRSARAVGRALSLNSRR